MANQEEKIIGLTVEELHQRREELKKLVLEQKLLLDFRIMQTLN